MESKKNHPLSKGTFLLLAAVAVSPLLSGFLLGFPFANHNESYAWVPRLARLAFTDIIFPSNALSYTYRPLADAFAWVLFHFSGGSIYPQQAVNTILALAGWCFLVCHFRSSVPAVFLLSAYSFAGYIYLFHLHGVFYSPLLIFCAILSVQAVRGTVSERGIYLLFGAAVFAGLFHPFALFLYAAFAAGKFLERFNISKRNEKTGIVITLLASLIILRLLLTREVSNGLNEMAAGVLASYRMLETFSVFGVVPLAFSLYAAASSTMEPRMKRVVSVLLLVLGALFFHFHLPLIFLWIAVCLLIALGSKKNGAVALLVAASLLPAASPTGSPTYTLFVLPVCVTLTFHRVTEEKVPSRVVKTGAAALLFAQAVLLITILFNSAPSLLLRPLIPLLGEKEKTHQMEKIIAWYNASQYRKTHKLSLFRNAAYPGTSGYSAVVTNRRFRAPAAQFDIDPYIEFFSGNKLPDGETLLVTFGGESPANTAKVYAVPGKYNGEAGVFRMNASAKDENEK